MAKKKASRPAKKKSSVAKKGTGRPKKATATKKAATKASKKPAARSPKPGTRFTSIPQSVYWAIVTMTTVGYGDIAPKTVIGQTLAAGVMILGYAIIIVPIGVFSTEILAAQK